MLIVPGILLTLSCLLPFLNKAYTIDDPVFLLEARQILKTPLQPMSYSVCWTAAETCVKSAASFAIGSAQALMGYVLVPVILSGDREWLAHLIQIVLACIAVIGMVRLSLWLGLSRMMAGVAGLVLVAAPPFLPMASTAMPDVLALALGLTGAERLFAWKSEHRWPQALAAGLMLGLATWARPHWVMFLAPASLWLFEEYRLSPMVNLLRRRAFLWAPILLAVCVILAVNLITRQRGPSPDAKQVMAGVAHPYRNLFAWFLYLACPIPLVGVWLIAHWRKAPFLLAPAIAFATLLAAVHSPGGLAPQWGLIVVLCAAPVIAHVFWVYLRRRDQDGLLLGLWLLSPLPAVIYEHFPIKYMLMVLPAAVLIALRSLSFLPRLRVVAIIGAVVSVCAGYSLLILKADEDFAEYGRRAARELIFPHVRRGEKVWYGGEWGFHWYAEQAGAQVSQPGGPGPRPGELLAVGLTEDGGVTRNRFPNRMLVDRREYDSPHGRTMSSGAGLYSNLFGNALWVWHPAATNVYELWRIQ